MVATLRGIAYALNFWWAGVVYMIADIDITDPDDQAEDAVKLS
ncbi:hypothetical protein [Bradyrhizobium phage BDU-MI-1]|nr:hypothetical protein [Bradyrhizobium phage BDU-MI-1]